LYGDKAHKNNVLLIDQNIFIL